MENINIINISYHGNSTWIFPILNELNVEMIEKYRTSDLSKWALSISTKLDMIDMLIDNVNNEYLKIKDELRESMDKVNECLANNWAYQVKEVKNIFLLLTYIESTIFEMYSLVDIMKKFIRCFDEEILNKEISNQKILVNCVKNGLDKNWEKNLKKVRNDLIHNYTG